jgi:hypothetical protein
LKTRDVEFEELRNKYEQVKLAAMDMANTGDAEKAQMMALQDVGEVDMCIPLLTSSRC